MKVAATDRSRRENAFHQKVRFFFLPAAEYLLYEYPLKLLVHLQTDESVTVSVWHRIEVKPTI